MNTFKITSTLILISSIMLISCEMTDNPLIVSDSVSLYEGETLSFSIDAGNGGYKVASQSETTATATVKGSTVMVNGKKDGKTRLLLTDAGKQSKQIDVVVGIPPVAFEKTFDAEYLVSALSEFGLKCEERINQETNSSEIVIKPINAMKAINYAFDKDTPIESDIIIYDLLDRPGEKEIVFPADANGITSCHIAVVYKMEFYLLHFNVIKSSALSRSSSTTVEGVYIQARKNRR